jgi:S1-C subfamily serine protease
MRKLLSAVLLGFLLIASPLKAAPKESSNKQFVQQVYDSVVLLYGQTESGGMQMHCTATAYEQLADKSGYRFVSAAHCVSGKTDKEQKAQKYYVTTDDAGSKTFLNATLIEAGDKSVGDDFSIFEVKTKLQFAVTPLGDSSVLTVGDRVINVASPFGLGKQYFEGYVSSTHLDRPPLDAGEVTWTDVMLVEVGSAGGSSGSAIVSEDQHAIVGFLVGGTSSTIGAICIPVDKFKAFKDAVAKGTYKKSKESDKLAGDEGGR